MDRTETESVGVECFLSQGEGFEKSGIGLMSGDMNSPELPLAVRRVLDAVRRRIRAYVWLEGLAILIVMLGIAFWLGLAADWSFEPSPAVRRSAIFVVGCLAAAVCYRYIIRRAFVPISDSSAAILLERSFPHLRDHVTTAVDISAPGRLTTSHADLVQQTQAAADEAVSNVRIGQLFNRRPLGRALGGAAILVLTIVVFAFYSPDFFGFWLDRIALCEDAWPRRVHLEVVGFPPNETGQRTHKLAQEDDLELLVHARTDGYEVPDEVEIRFRLADGRRGRDTLIKVGDSDTGRDRFQLFRYQFKHVTGDMVFDIVAGDDRVRDLHLQVVDRPELFNIQLACVYPEYLGREPRRLPVTGGMRIPEGSRLVLHATSTKPLTAARIHTSHHQHDVALSMAKQPTKTLEWQYGTLPADDVLLVNVTDIDGVAAREPYRVSLAVVKDEVPQVAVRLSGIGIAITPDAVLPLAGKIIDDYGIDRAWFEYRVDGSPNGTRPLANQPHGEQLLDKLGQFDTRATDDGTGQRALALRPGQKLSLWLKAADRFNLKPSQDAAQQSPRAGSSQQFTLDVVTPADLLALLERRELSLRQRFEAIHEKLTDTRNLLGRIDFDDSKETIVEPSPNGDKGGNTASQRTAGEQSEATAQRSLARRRLRIAGSLQNVVQSADEVGGVADAFDDLGSELTNNRIDNPDLKSRLGEQIARPLHQIAEKGLPQLAEQLKLVDEHVEDPKTAAPALKDAIARADAILVEMRQVLDKMLELETYNEVVALLRGIINDQDQINQRVKERQKEKFGDLFQN
jgi:hypothetical protein